MKKFQEKTTQLRQETYAFYLAYKDPRLIWWKKLLIMVGYLFSPIDLIPDFIPILGYIDDLVIVPLGLSLAIKLIPRKLWMTVEKDHEKNKKRKFLLERKQLL